MRQMMKNTFEIIKKNRVLPWLFNGMVAYIVLTQLLDMQIYHVFFPFIMFIDNIFATRYIGYDIIEYILYAIGAALLLAPAMHYIRLVVTEQSTEGFYKAGLKRNWYKAALLVLAVLILWDIVKYIRFGMLFSSIYRGFYIVMFLINVLGIALFTFMLWLLVSMSSEIKFIDGIKNIFKSGKKYLLFSAASAIVVWALRWLYDIDFYSDINNTVFVTLVMLLQGAIVMFTLTLGMNEYEIRKKEKGKGKKEKGKRKRETP